MNSYTQKISHIGNEIIRSIIRVCLTKPAIMLRLDGGTCSQMNDYINIKEIQEKGYRVLADMSWYDEHADLDTTSISARPYNLDKLFELSSYDVASKFQIWLYKKYFSFNPSQHIKKLCDGQAVDLARGYLPESPCYLCGYWRFSEQEYGRLYNKYFCLKSAEDILDDQLNRDIWQDIMNHPKSIAVHIRRGDAKKYHAGSYQLLPIDYYINICKTPEIQDYKFYFFSEEPEWIRKMIIPQINVAYHVVANNPSYYGYKDLYLMSNCLYQVKSNGSFGYYAYLMNNKENKRLIVYDETRPDLWRYKEQI